MYDTDEKNRGAEVLGMNILTFDIEDWYNCDFISEDFDWDKWEYRIPVMLNPILDELDRRELKATFFCLGWVAEKHPEVIKEIDKRGHQIGCHSYQHELSTRLTPEQFVEDTSKAKKLIEDVIAKPVECFRAPAFSITANNTWAIDKLVEMGFRFDSSVFPSYHDYGGMPHYGKSEPAILRTPTGVEIKEFPINIRSIMGRNIVFSGGGFFRFFPYWLIKKWATGSDYMMTYFHTRDFDIGQPKVQGLPLKRQFKSYVGIKGAWKKWTQLLDDFEFVNITQGNRMVDWDVARVVSL